MNNTDYIGTGIINELTSRLTTGKLTELEIARCTRELEIVLSRLATREYLQSSFQPRNLLAIPDRTDEIFKDLEFFFSIGMIWKEIFNQVNIEQVNSILDIGCGYFPKAELGLYYSNYNGRVTLLDSDSVALGHAHKFLKFFAVEFSINKQAATFWQAKPCDYDLIIANHALDDLILDAAAKENKLDLNVIYKSENLYVEIWTWICGNPRLASKLMEELAIKMGALLENKGMIILLDYPSFSHSALQLDWLTRFVASKQRELKTSLLKHGFKLINPHIRNNIKHGRVIVKPRNLIIMSK